MTTRGRRRLPTAVSGLALVALGWALFALAVWLAGADPGHPPPADRLPPASPADRWETLLASGLIASFLAYKAWMMARRTVVWGRLGAALVAANAAFALLYVYVAVAAVWPGVGTAAWALDAVPGAGTWPGALRWVDALRLLIVLTAGWGIVELAATPDPDPDEPDPWDLLADCDELRREADRLTIENARLAALAGEPPGRGAWTAPSSSP